MLNWEKIDGWEKFERLCLYVCDEELKLNTFNLYLRKGYEQHGIDIKGFDFGTGLYTCIQCKHTQSLSLKGLKELIREFRDGIFYSKSNKFILTTTADLCEKEIEDYITEQEVAFKKDGIEFQCWDKVKMSEKLKKYARVVEHFFTIGDALNHCMKAVVKLPEYPAVPDFIERKIQQVRQKEAGHDTAFWLNNTEELLLTDLLLQMDQPTARICIIADPQEGKSSLVKQMAYELSNKQVPSVPVIVELKNAPLEPIISILDRYHPYWINQSSSELILILDGLDEVAGEDFIETVKLIDGFSIEYPTIRMVVSCRTLFYYRYWITQYLKGFNYFELCVLTYESIEAYTQKKLGNKAEKFHNFIHQNDIHALLYKPFYLTYLTGLYFQSGRQMPQSRIEILDHCIGESMESSKVRQYKRGRLFEHKIVCYKKALRKLSFALQLAGRNSFQEEEMQILFSDDELELLQHSTLISRRHNQWSFNTAFFQEHLAGGVLARLDFEKIKELTTVGKNICKIKPKWVQTLASCLSILEKNDEKRASIISLIENDNMELLTLADPNQFLEEERLGVLKKIIQRYKTNNTRPVFNDIRENNIGGFCSRADSAAKFLIQVIAGKSTEMLKNTCWKILRFSSPHKRHDKAVYDLAKKELLRTADGYYANNVCQTLASLGIGDRGLGDSLVTHLPMQADHNYREGVYRLIIALGLVDHYYDFGLKGYDVLFAHNRSTTYSMSEKTLENFLLSTDNEENLKKLLVRIMADDWINFYRFKDGLPDSFEDRLIKKLMQVYQRDPLILFPVVRLFRFIVKRHTTKNFEKVKTFFYGTGTNVMALKLFFLEPGDLNHWEYYGIVNEDCFDHIFFLYDEGVIDTQVLRSIYAGIKHFGELQTAGLFLNRVKLALEGNIEDKNHIAEYKTYMELQQLKISNDRKYIQTIEAFKDGIIEFFKEHGKQDLSGNDLYIDDGAKGKRQLSSSNLVHSFLIGGLRQSKTVSQKSTLARLENEDTFEDFRAFELKDYSCSQDEILEFRQMLSAYYSKYIDTTDFTNAVFNHAGKRGIKTRPSILADLFVKFRFETPRHVLPELLWLDQKTNVDKRRDTLTGLVIERLSKNEMASLEKIISDRLKTGIIDHDVLENHLEICGDHNFTSINPQLLELIRKKRFREYYYNKATDIYISLGGNTDDLEPIFKSLSCTHPYFWYLADLLRKSHVELVTERLLDSLEHKSDYVGIDAASRLADMGIRKGFSFLIKKIGNAQVSPITIQGRYKLHNVDTDFALREISHMCDLILDRREDDQRAFYVVPGNVVLEVLHGLAMKNEDDLVKVTKFLRRNFRLLKGRYTNAIDLLWYADQYTEQYRRTDSKPYTIEQIGAVLASVS
jgi:hypothetical protein